MAIKLHGKVIPTDKEGYIQSLNDWSAEPAAKPTRAPSLTHRFVSLTFINLPV